MKPPSKPAFIKNWRELEPPQPWTSSSGEGMGYPVSFADATGLTRLKIMHLRLPPGARSNVPGAYLDEEEFFFVLEGTPDLWLDGHLHALNEGEGAALHDRTGLSHTIINNTDKDVRLFVMGEATRVNSKFHVPLAGDAGTAERLGAMGKLWTDPPRRRLGPHEGHSDKVRGAPPPKGSRKRGRPACVTHWRDIISAKPNCYDNDTEPQGLNASFGRWARFSRIGLHVEVLKPGRRSSRPHAERDEDEFAYVVSGRIDAWNDGWVTPLGEGDFIGWQGGTGITHVLMNNSDEDAVLIVGGEAGRRRNQFWYPYHLWYNRQLGELYWADHPVPSLGPHDGIPDAQRARLPAAVRRTPLAANNALHRLTAKPARR